MFNKIHVFFQQLNYLMDNVTTCCASKKSRCRLYRALGWPGSFSKIASASSSASDLTRWDPMGPGSFRSFRSKVLIRRFLNSNRSNLIHFQWFPMIAWLIYGYLWYDLLGPLWTPPKAAFQSRLAAVRPQGDPRVAPWWCHAVKRSGTFTHPLRQRSLQYYAILFEYYLNIIWILFEYYLNIIWILCSNNVVYWRVPQQISWANMSESWCSWTGLHEKE